LLCLPLLRFRNLPPQSARQAEFRAQPYTSNKGQQASSDSICSFKDLLSAKNRYSFQQFCHFFFAAIQSVRIRLSFFKTPANNGLSFAKTPRGLNLIHLTCYTTSLYVVDFQCALILAGHRRSEFGITSAQLKVRFRERGSAATLRKAFRSFAFFVRRQTLILVSCEQKETTRELTPPAA